MSMIYFEEDGSLDAIAGKTVGIIGYADMGRAIALNLRDNGVPIVVSPLGPFQSSAAETDGVAMAIPLQVAERANIILLTMRDEDMPLIYQQQISPHLRKGDTLLLTSAYNLAFGFIEPPPFVDVGVIAPRTGGETVREAFLDDDGVMSFVAVAQDASRSAWDTLLAIAYGAGLLQAGAMEITLEQEAELSLFIQQAIVPAFQHIMLTAVNLLLRTGYPADPVMTDLYIDGKFNDFLRQTAREGMLNAIKQKSLTEQYATMSRIDRFRELKLDRLMEVTLDEIRNGEFAKEWSREFTDGAPRLNKLLKQQTDLDVWDYEQQVLDLLDD